MTPLWFVLAAASGALVRHGVNLLGRGWYGTLALNVVGALTLGYLAGSGASADVLVVAGTAGCGSLTTFSTFALETVEVRGAPRLAIVGATVVGVVGAAALGHVLA